MTKLTANAIRKMWLDFFRSKDHYELPSVSLIPVDDPSLLWINSGVATLKPYFDGRKTPPAPRLTNSQKSIRTNDIENVGHTARHHTLFEMLGNFSIGDYFKKEAIVYAWEFLTDKKWIGFSPDKLYVTVYKDDQEAYEVWHNVIGLSPERIIKGDKDTNFWEIGEGPCGPNTEIFYDRGEKYDPEHVGIRLLQEDLENDRYLEVWNIVFSQYNNNGDGTYTDLPRKNIDTGAGLERITSIIQETPTNFETDLFMPIIKAVEKLVQGKYHYDQTALFTSDAHQIKINTAFKVIADHLRAVTFAIADGAFPGNKDRGYVIRRLIRRASLYGKKLGLEQPFLYQLVQTVITIMSEYYTYLIEKQPIIEQAVLDEENKFLKTLEQGNKLFNEVKTKYGIISKEHAFRLFESYGFPIELIVEEAHEAGIKVDRTGFEELLANAKEISRTNRKDIKAIHLQSELFTQLDVVSKFVGYEHEQVNNTEIVFMFANDQPVSELTNTTGYLILAETPFYAEKGGQATDRGLILKDNNTAYVLDVQQGPNKQHLHFVRVEGTLKSGDLVNASIDSDRRFYTRKNHSGTHLIHAALREVLGTHVMQTGSYNDDERLRIDITHNQPIIPEEIMAVEASVRKAIRAAIPCEIIYTDMQTALEVHQALAFFTEKYDEEVRIIKFGTYSCELCGGTHVANSQDVEDLLVTGIESKGVGTFRIHAITSNRTIASYLNEQFLKEKTEAINYFEKYNQGKAVLTNQELEQIWNQISNLTVSKENWKLLKQLVNQFKESFKHWQKQYDNVIMQDFVKQYHALPLQEKNGIQVLTYQFPTKVDVNALKVLIDDYKARYSNILIFFVDITDSTQQKLVVGVSDTLHDRYQAGRIIQQLNSLLDGKGGGNNSVAQSGFKNKTIIAELLADPLLFLQQHG
ncbi:alanyl-tRNA synthetase [Spiroplasma sp. NBRC 100390]|uniref:alanine--tRNA ligase n=1 Tax=unclassified Spiroplasma TaxID=2637901 RepID=UPI0008929257|nr:MULTISPECIES: alanine--tRNA ligase [unclassified Spiroplasma]AOX43934.1 alanyl-tRNA synthetase [Spiroplasma sp. TU-14]APE13404.1 alanyl-tRNA synthetase [Spiroplasma sp. NBRC 100390]